MAPDPAAPAPARGAGPASLGRLPRGLGDDGVLEILRAAAGEEAGGGGPGWRRAPGGLRAAAVAGGGGLQRFGFAQFSGLAGLARALEVLPGAAVAGGEGLAFTVSAGVRAQLGVWRDEQRRRGEGEGEGEAGATEARRRRVLEILGRHASAEASAAAEDEARCRASELAGALEREKRRESKAQKERHAEERQAKARQVQLLGQVEDRQRQRAERLREERKAARERVLEVERDLADPEVGRRRSAGRRRRRRREQEQDARDRDEEAREAMLVGAAGGPSSVRRLSVPSAPQQVDEKPEAPAGLRPGQGAGAAPAPAPAPRRVGFGLPGLGKPRGPPARRKALLGGFGGEDEDERPTRTIVPIDYSDDDEPAPKRSGPLCAPPRAGSLEKVPRTLQGVLEHEVDWGRFTEAALDRAVRPWVAEKLRGLLGGEGGGGDGEASLGEFIAGKLRARAPPGELLGELAPMLDEEAAGGLVCELYQTVIRETLRFSAEGQ